MPFARNTSDASCSLRCSAPPGPISAGQTTMTRGFAGSECRAQGLELVLSYPSSDPANAIVQYNRFYTVGLRIVGRTWGLVRRSQLPPDSSPRLTLDPIVSFERRVRVRESCFLVPFGALQERSTENSTCVIHAMMSNKCTLHCSCYSTVLPASAARDVIDSTTTTLQQNSLHTLEHRINSILPVRLRNAYTAYRTCVTT